MYNRYIRIGVAAESDNTARTHCSDLILSVFPLPYKQDTTSTRRRVYRVVFFQARSPPFFTRTVRAGQILIFRIFNYTIYLHLYKDLIYEFLTLLLYILYYCKERPVAIQTFVFRTRTIISYFIANYLTDGFHANKSKF